MCSTMRIPQKLSFVAKALSIFHAKFDINMCSIDTAHKQYSETQCRPPILGCAVQKKVEFVSAFICPPAQLQPTFCTGPV